MSKPSVLLVSFYNQKSLGIRYLESALTKRGIDVNLVFFKGFNSVAPELPTDNELNHLKLLIEQKKPTIIGLSVMTSMYLEAVEKVNSMIRKNFNIPLLWGGVYTTLFPEDCLKKADFVIKGEGEDAICELVSSLYHNKDYEKIPNLGYIKDGQVVVNQVRPLEQELDELGYPSLGGENKFFINNEVISNRDPQLDSLSYELTASRGCPFACSYCCSINIKRIYKGSGNYVRFRSVDSVMEEIWQAKKKMKNLKFIHFWDEIFSDNEEWVDEFVVRYKKEIGLPFEIWGHPLKANEKLLRKLVDAGLYKVVMGIQSGSQRIRKEIFHRRETQEEIITASRNLRNAKVPQVIFDFILQHPFETDEDIRQTYDLCDKLQGPFELQLHRLSFFPGSDIVQKALDQKLLTKEEMDKLMYGSMSDLYSNYWRIEHSSEMSKFWYAMTFLSQFRIINLFAKILSKYNKHKIPRIIGQYLYKLARPLKRTRYVYKKGILVLRSVAVKLRSCYNVWLP